MSTRSQTPKGASRRRRPATAAAGAGFLDAWANLVPDWMPALPRRRGRKPRVSIDQILHALTFHVTHGGGTLAEHFVELFQEPLADSSWSDRRRRLPWEVFAELMGRALRPIATRRRHPDACWRGWGSWRSTARTTV